MVNELIKGIAHVCISSTDLQASERFYLEGLGLTKCFDFVRNDDIVGYYLKVSDRMFIEAFRRDEVEDGGKAPVRHFCLETDNIDAVRDRLIEKGYEVGEKKARCRPRLPGLGDRPEWCSHRIPRVHGQEHPAHRRELHPRLIGRCT